MGGFKKKTKKKRELFVVCFERARERERDPFFSTMAIQVVGVLVVVVSDFVPYSF